MNARGHFWRYIAWSTGLFSFGYLMVISQAAHAAAVTEAFAAKSFCDIGSAFQEFKSAEAQTATSTPEDSPDVASSTEPEEQHADPALLTRQELLAQILDCAKKDTEHLLSVVRELPISGIGAKDIQANIEGRLEESNFRIASFLERTGGASTIDDTKAIAREISAWRKDEYLPLTENAVVFVVWANNETLIEKAGNRIFQVRQTLKSLKLKNEDPVERLFEQAKVHSLHAEENHLKAKQGIERFSRGDEILGYIQSSLNDLHKLYASLLELSSVVAKTIK